MNRDLYRLIKALRRLSADDIARVQTFINQMRAANLRSAPAELKTVPSALAEAQAEAQTDALLVAEARGPVAARLPVAVESAANEPMATEQADPAAAEAGSTEASPLARWRRRAFQGIPEAELRPIAILVREARETKAVARLRYGAV